MTQPPDDAMRRAEKIASHCAACVRSNNYIDISFIAAEIRAAYRDGCTDTIHNSPAFEDAVRAAVEEEAQLRADWNVVIEELQKALANAYEVAAQIAGSNCLGNAVNGVTNETCPTANLIRAKAKELE